jgi:hypothetical protein
VTLPLLLGLAALRHARLPRRATRITASGEFTDPDNILNQLILNAISWNDG